MDEKDLNGSSFTVYKKAERDLKPLYQGLEEHDIEELVKLMQEPLLAIERCMTRPELEQVCKQLLTQNLVLQKKLAKVQR